MSKKVFVKSNGMIRLIELQEITDILSPGNYLVKYDIQNKFFYLQESEAFNLPNKIYGDMSCINRWITAFNNTEKNLGIILSGTKGSGKSLTSQYLCKQLNVPVLFITEAYGSAEFIEFMSNPLLHGSIVFIDEYEKIYDERELYDLNDDTVKKGPQYKLLSLMDGMFNTHLLFLLTVNDFENVNDNMKNRLGRIKYHKQFGILPEDVINDVINDLLVNKNHKEDLLSVCEKLPLLNMDMLVTMIKDINLFDEPATTVVKHLNIVREAKYYLPIVTDKNGNSVSYGNVKVAIPNGKFKLHKGHQYSKDEFKLFPDDVTIDLTKHTIIKSDLGYSFEYKDFVVYLNHSENILNLVF